MLFERLPEKIKIFLKHCKEKRKSKVTNNIIFHFERTDSYIDCNSEIGKSLQLSHSRIIIGHCFDKLQYNLLYYFGYDINTDEFFYCNVYDEYIQFFSNIQPEFILHW